MSLDSIIDLNISIKDATVSRAGFGTPLICATSGPFAGAVRSYGSASAIADDGFSLTSPTYRAAQAVFSQSPSPSIVKVGIADGDFDTVAETVNNVASIDDDWYALIVGTSIDSDVWLSDVAAWSESRRKLLLATSEDPDILDAGESGDIATTLRDLGFSEISPEKSR